MTKFCSLQFQPGLAQAFHMNCGFNCLSKCHLCDGQDWHEMGEGAAWRGTCWGRRTTSPYHNVHIPLLEIPGMCAETILPDSLHCFHLGWGQDLASSGIVLLCKLQYFNGGTLDAKLASAYANYTQWLSRSKKTSGIDWWSKKKLDMTSTLF